MSSRALDHVIQVAAKRPSLRDFNDVSLTTLRSLHLDEDKTPDEAQHQQQRQSQTELHFGRVALDRVSARLVLECIARYTAPRLRVLDLARADLMPSAHPHPRSPELFGVGHLCNACATHHPLTVDLNLACQICDNDACGAAWRSGDIVEDLAAALLAAPCLERLGLNGCCFTTMGGPVTAQPFEKLGAALSSLRKLTYVDLRNNTWTGPYLTRWCADSISTRNDNSQNRDNDDDDDEDDLRGQSRWRREQALHANRDSDDDNDAEEEDDDDDDEDDAHHQGDRHGDDAHSLSRKRLPLAAGWPFLARGLARCVALDRVDVSKNVSVDLGGLARTMDDDGILDASRFAQFPKDDDSSDSERRQSAFDLAGLVLFVDALRFSPRIRSVPRRLRVNLKSLPEFCKHRAQVALVPLMKDLEVLDVVDGGLLIEDADACRKDDGPKIRLDLAALRSGAAEYLKLPSRVHSGSAGYGVLVAAAIDAARNLRHVEAYHHQFGADTEDVVKAVLRCESLASFNGIGCRGGGWAMSRQALSPLLGDGGGSRSRSDDNVEKSSEKSVFLKLDFHGRGITDVGATLLVHWFATDKIQGPRVRHLDLRRTGLEPEGVAAVVGGLAEAPALETLDLSHCRVEDVGVAKLAAYLRQNPSLRTLRLVEAALPRSTTPAMEAFGLALENNSTLAVLDIRCVIPLKLARALSRTFLEKQPTCELPMPQKLAFLFALRKRNVALDDDVKRAIFAMVRTKRVLKKTHVHDAISDQLQDLSAPARDLVDRMDSGALDFQRENDINEINAILAELDTDNQQKVMTAFQAISRTRHGLGANAPPENHVPDDVSVSDDENESDDDDEEELLSTHSSFSLADDAMSAEDYGDDVNHDDDDDHGP